MIKISLKRAQISLEFAILFLVILVVSIIYIYNFLSNNLTKEDINLDKIDIAAKSAVILVNSNYNGIHSNVTLVYGGLSWSGNKKNITIYISPRSYVTVQIKNFIISYIYNTTTKINSSEYNITVDP
ncbi:MAG: class III signal peptide-containing protein [Methanocaldococcus sp.]|nr:class III signal peptide-containing protein [Methanocaldococcus sp.]MCQ6253499.1 class III signal peptide-containing protein [Methanocaldococcus sp.]